MQSKDTEKLLSIYRTMEFKKFATTIENEMKKQGKAVNDESNGKISLFGGIVNHPDASDNKISNENRQTEDKTNREKIESSDEENVLNWMKDEV